MTDAAPRVTAPADSAIADILRERQRQVLLFRHDAEADRDRPAAALPRKARDYLTIAVDVIDGRLCPRDLPRARTKLVQAGALILAAIDRLAAEEP